MNTWQRQGGEVFLYFLFLVGSRGFGAPVVTVKVPGSASPYLSGMPSGTICCAGDSAPAQSPALASGLTLTSGAKLIFSVSGSVDTLGGQPTEPPDGSGCTGGNGENGIAAVAAPGNSLLGVFLD